MTIPISNAEQEVLRLTALLAARDTEVARLTGECAVLVNALADRTEDVARLKKELRDVVIDRGVWWAKAGIAEAALATLRAKVKEEVDFMERLTLCDTPAQFTNPDAHPWRGMVEFDAEEMAEDAKAPFFSEAYLYNLLGKEDARTLLAIVHRLHALDLPDTEGPCSCHLGSVCGPSCKRGRHHSGCPKATPEST